MEAFEFFNGSEVNATSDAGCDDDEWVEIWAN